MTFEGIASVSVKTMCAGLGQTCALGSTSCGGGVSCLDTTTFGLCGTAGSCLCGTN